jgi:hypothetical protein
MIYLLTANELTPGGSSTCNKNEQQKDAKNNAEL